MTAAPIRFSSLSALALASSPFLWLSTAAYINIIYRAHSSTARAEEEQRQRGSSRQPSSNANGMTRRPRRAPRSRSALPWFIPGVSTGLSDGVAMCYISNHCINPTAWNVLSPASHSQDTIDLGRSLSASLSCPLLLLFLPLMYSNLKPGSRAGLVTAAEFSTAK